jgi:hypothetical protein
MVKECLHQAEWNLDIPKPTMAQLDAFEAQATDIVEKQSGTSTATRIKALYGTIAQAN